MERLSLRSWWRAAFSGVVVAMLAACNYSSSSGGSNAGLSVDENAPRLNAATLVEVDAGGPGEGDILVLTFDRSVVISGGDADGQVIAIRADAASDTFGVGASVLYVADSGRHRVVVYSDVRGGPPFVAARHVLGQPNLATDQGQALEGPSFATLHCPQGIFFNGYELLVSDQGNSRLAIFR